MKNYFFIGISILFIITSQSAFAEITDDGRILAAKFGEKEIHKIVIEPDRVLIVMPNSQIPTKDIETRLLSDPDFKQMIEDVVDKKIFLVVANTHSILKFHNRTEDAALQGGMVSRRSSWVQTTLLKAIAKAYNSRNGTSYAYDSKEIMDTIGFYFKTEIETQSYQPWISITWKERDPSNSADEELAILLARIQEIENNFIDINDDLALDLDDLKNEVEDLKGRLGRIEEKGSEDVEKEAPDAFEKKRPMSLQTVIGLTPDDAIIGGQLNLPSDDNYIGIGMQVARDEKKKPGSRSERNQLLFNIMMGPESEKLFNLYAGIALDIDRTNREESYTTTQESKSAYGADSGNGEGIVNSPLCHTTVTTVNIKEVETAIGGAFNLGCNVKIAKILGFTVVGYAQLPLFSMHYHDGIRDTDTNKKIFEGSRLSKEENSHDHRTSDKVVTKVLPLFEGEPHTQFGIRFGFQF